MKIYKNILKLLIFIFLSFNIGYTAYLNPKLKELILDALKKSSYIQSLKLSLDAHKLNEDILKKTKGPNLDFSLGFFPFQFQHTFKPASRNDFSTLFSLSLNLNYILYDPKHRLNIENAKINFSRQKLSYLREKLNIEYNFIKLYLKFLKVKDLLKLEKENLNLSKKIYLLALEKYKSGIVSQEEIINYLLFLKEKQKELFNLESELLNLKERLSHYLKEKNIPALDLGEFPKKVNIKPINLEEQDIKKLILMKKISIKKLKEKLVIRLTSSFNLASSLDWENLSWDNSNTFSGLTLGISLSFPIFDNHKTDYEILKIKKEILSLEKKLEDIKSNFYLNLKEKWNIYKNNKHNFELQKKITKLYEETFSINNEKFQQGQVSLENVLKAQKNLLASKKKEILTFYQTWESFFDYLKTANIDLLSF